MNAFGWEPIDWLACFIPVIAILISVRIGIPQVREFRARTGDHSLVTGLAAMSFANHSETLTLKPRSCDSVDRRIADDEPELQMRTAEAAE
jgi:hypothetical protein